MADYSASPQLGSEESACTCWGWAVRSAEPAGWSLPRLLGSCAGSGAEVAFLFLVPQSAQQPAFCFARLAGLCGPWSVSGAKEK